MDSAQDGVSTTYLVRLLNYRFSNILMGKKIVLDSASASFTNCRVVDPKI
jgi:hypothetical protein